MSVDKLKRHVLAHYEIAAEEGDKSLTVSGVVVAAALDGSLEVGAVLGRCTCTCTYLWCDSDD